MFYLDPVFLIKKFNYLARIYKSKAQMYFIHVFIQQNLFSAYVISNNMQVLEKWKQKNLD